MSAPCHGPVSGIHTQEVMVVLVTHGSELPHRKQLVAHLRERIPGLVSLMQNIQPRRKSQVTLGRENRVLLGRASDP